MVLVTWMTGGDGVGWSVGYWACELALIALKFLYLALETAEFGSFDLTWIDDTHPDPIARRDELRQIWLDPRVPPVRVSAARELCGMSDSLCGRLWEFVSAALFLQHKQGGRASPIWQALIHDTFAKKS